MGRWLKADATGPESRKVSSANYTVFMSLVAAMRRCPIGELPMRHVTPEFVGQTIKTTDLTSDAFINNTSNPWANFELH